MPLVDIPDVGTVDFPDEMSQDAITSAIKDSIVPGVKAGKWKSFLEPQAKAVKTTPVSTGVLPMKKPTVFEPTTGIITPTIPEQQPPEDWGAPVEIGKGEATIPRFGKEGTITRGVSDIASSLGEFALNRPEELALSVYPPTSLVMASKYLPGIASQTVQDIADTVYGDKEAAGRVLGIAATLAIPGAAKEARAQYLTKGPPSVPVVPPEIQAIAQSRVRDTAGQISPLEGVVPEPSTLVNLPEALQPATLMPKSFQMVTAPDRGERRAILKARAPVVPETPPEAERALTVIQEIRQRGLTTKEQIRKAFPQLSRQEAAVLRDQAFPREKVPDNLSKADVNRLFLDRLNEESEAQLKAETERPSDATRIREDERQVPERGVEPQGGAEQSRSDLERQAQEQPSGTLPQAEAQAPVAPQVELAAIPADVLETQQAWKHAEKRWRRAKRQEPSDVENADEARIEAEGIFRDKAAQAKLSQEQFDALRSDATMTETEATGEVEPATASKAVGLQGSNDVSRELEKMALEATPESSWDMATGRKVVSGNGQIFLEAERIWQKTLSIDQVDQFLKSSGLTGDYRTRLEKALNEAKQLDYTKTPLQETVYRGGEEEGTPKHIGTSVTTKEDVARSYGPTKEFTLKADDVLAHDKKVPEHELLARGMPYELVRTLGENPTGREILEGVTKWLRETHGETNPSSVGQFLKGLGWQAYKMADQSFVFDKNVLKTSAKSKSSTAPAPALTEGGAPEAGKVAVEKPITETRLTPENVAKTPEQKAFRSTVEGQKAMSSRSSRIALLHQLNEAIRKVDPKEAYDRNFLESLPDSQIDQMRDSLIQDYNRTRPKPTTPTPPSAEPSVGPGAASPDPAASFSSSVKDVPVKSKVAANLAEKSAEKQNLGITALPPIVGTGLAKVGNSIKAGLRELRDIPKFTAFKETVNRWFGQNQKTSLEVRALQKDIESRVPTEARREAITNYLQADGDTALLDAWAKGTKNPKRKAAYEAAKSLTPDELKIAQAVRKLYDDYLTKAQAYDLVDTGIEDYVTQVWKRPLLGGSQFAQFASKLSPQFRFGKQRVFENFFEGEQAGFKPVTKDISKLVGLYVSEMGKTIATRDFIKDLTTKDATDGRPLAAPSGVGSAVLDKNATPSIFVRPNAKNKTLRDYSRWTHPALTGWKWVAEDPISGAPVLLKGNLVLHPDIAGHVENILSRSAIKRWYDTPSTPMGVLPKALAKGLDQWQGVTKQIMLGFFAPFHHVQEATHALGHRVNPVFDLPTLNHADPNLQRAMNHGLAVAGDNAAMESFREGVGAGKIFGKIPIVGEWANQWSDFLFHEYIPRLKWKTYQDILKRNLERYQAEIVRGDATIDDVEYLSSKQTNAAFGHQNYADLGRNPTIQHIARTLALAPDFLEARTRFFGQALKGAIGKEGREQLMAMATLAGTFWVGSRIINKLGSGDYHNEEPFGVVLGGRTYTMRSVPEDAWRAFKDSRKFIYGRVSPIIGRGTIELLTGKNYRGEKTTALETMQDLLASWVPITLRNLPGVEKLSPSQVNRSVNAWEAFLGAMGVQISRHSPISKGYQLGGEYMKAQGIKEDRGSYPVSKYQQLRYALEDSDLEKAAVEIRRLRESEKMTSSKLQKGFHESLFHPWTKSEAMDRQFKFSLTAENKMLVNEAEEQRRRVWQRFAKARGMSFAKQP